MTTIDAVAGALGAQPGQLLKAFPVVTESRGLVNVFVRGDHRVNEIKLRNALGEDVPARARGRAQGPGRLPRARRRTCRRSSTRRSSPGPYVAGANRPDCAHGRRGRRPASALDVRTVEAGDTVGGAAIHIEPAIEVGNIFKLGTRYSEPLGATYLDENGKEQLIWMGSYGIGPARIAAAAVEQFADEQGISWPKAIAPWDVHVVAARQAGHRRGQGRRGALRRAARGRPRRPARRPRRGRGGEVRRRRAARAARCA